MTQKIFVDQMLRNVKLNFPPRRIISLVPSQTELLFDLGLDTEVVGITKFCIHPEHQFSNKTRVGGTKNVDFDRIASLKPDLIIGNKEENEQNVIERLAQQYPVWMSDIKTLSDAFGMIREVGELVNCKIRGLQIVNSVETNFSALRLSKPIKIAYFIWKKPYMVAAADTFIDEMLRICGFQNAFAKKKRYPIVTLEEIKASQATVLFLSSEPYPFKEKHIAELQQKLPNVAIYLVDGEYFSWYGSRMLGAGAYFQKLIDKI